MPSAVCFGDLSCDTRRTIHDPRDDDGWNVIAEVGNSGNIKKKYIHGPRVDEILSQKKGNQTLYLTRDGLGSTRELTKENGNVQQRFDYDAFGAVTVMDKDGAVIPDAPKTNYLFTGRELQPETGLYNYRNRFYHPGVGRFLQMDPVGEAAGDVNLYSYVQNDPINSYDPSGMVPGQHYALPEDAAREALKEIAAATRNAEGIFKPEFSATLYSGCDEKGQQYFSYTKLHEGRYLGYGRWDVGYVESAPEGATFKGVAHSHPLGGKEGFSDDDYRYADRTRTNAYVVYTGKQGDKAFRYAPYNKATHGSNTTYESRTVPFPL